MPAELDAADRRPSRCAARPAAPRPSARTPPASAGAQVARAAHDHRRRAGTASTRGPAEPVTVRMRPHLAITSRPPPRRSRRRARSTASTSRPPIVSRSHRAVRVELERQRTRAAIAEEVSSKDPAGLSELLEEAQIVGEEPTDVVDLILEHGDALDPHAEGEAGVPLPDRSRRRGRRSGRSSRRRESRSSRCPCRCGTRRSLPPQPKQPMSTSALGSVKGKKLGRSRTAGRAPKSRRTACVSTPFRSAKVTWRSTMKPSIWWNIGECVASLSSWR